MVTIQYATGTQKTLPTLQAALDWIQEWYPEAVFENQHGDVILGDDEEARWSLAQEHGCILVWKDEATSLDDDGSRIVATVKNVNEEEAHV